MFAYNAEGLLLNIFFVTFPLIFYSIILNENTLRRPWIRDGSFFLLFGGSAVLCMTFPITHQNGLLFDFRIIPVILAGLYGNLRTALAVYAGVVAVRFVLGGNGAYLNLVSSTIALLFILIAVRKYRSLTLVQKIVLCAGIALSVKVIGISGNLLFNPDYKLSDAIVFYIFQAMFMGITVYLAEAVRRSAQMRKDLIESEKMKVVSVISASMAHEIRNPLTVVRGFIQLLTRDGLASDKRRQYGQLSLEELDRALQIINDYLALAKPQPETIERLNVGDEIRYVSQVLTSYANLNGAHVNVQCESDLFIEGDRLKFRQGIINLAKNGIESMVPRGGTLVLSARKRKRQVILRISDDGADMTGEQIGRLGTPYFSTKEKGTGLGTMVSFNILRNMKGHLRVESKVGQGTLFEIAFPQAAEGSGKP